MKLMVWPISCRKKRGRALVMMMPCLLMGLYCFSQHSGKLTIAGKNITLHDLFDSIERKTFYKISYPEDIFQDIPTFTLNYKNVEADSLLRLCFADLPLRDSIFCRTNIAVYHRKGMALLRGQVTDNENTPLASATISLKGSPRTVLTNEEGYFFLTLETAAIHTVKVSYTGYYSQEIIVGGRNTLNITMEQATANMNAPVVIPYGSALRRLNTESISEVKGPVLQQQPVDNVWAGLEGQVPGLSIEQTSGVPGSAYKIELRGQNSIGQGDLPLVLLNGTPLMIDNSSLGYIGANSAQGKMGANLLNFISLTDIESVVVLKDAAATAIYGSRGANGVILITAKKGTPGKSRWSVNTYYGVNRVVNPMKLLNAQQYGALRKEAIQSDEDPVDTSHAPELFLWDARRNTNFPALLIGNTAPVQNVNVQTSGGNAGYSYLVSGTWYDESSVFAGSRGYSRGSVYGSLRHQSPNQRFDWDLSGIYSTATNHLPYEDLTKYIYEAPVAPPVYDQMGRYNWQENGLHDINAPAQETNTYRADTRNLFNHLQVSYKLFTGLAVKGSFGYNTVTTDETTINPLTSQNPDNNPTGTYIYSKTNYNTLIIEPMTEYIRDFGKSHLEVLLGATWQQQGAGFLSTTSEGYTSDALLGVSSAAPITLRSDNHVLYRYEAVFGRVNYNWREKYLLSLSGRRDGSSRFGPGKQFGNFGAIGAGWIFSDEAFFKKNNWLSFGKLRVSYGTTGNDQIGDYKFSQTFAATNSTLGYQGSQGVYPTNLYNNNLAWEINHKAEAGIDLGFLQNKVNLSVAYYRNRSSNQLVNATLPLQTGFPGVFSNLPAVVQNKGLEMTLQALLVDTRNFHWSSLLTLSFPKNALLSFPNLANSTYSNSLVIGQPLNSIRGYQYEGVDPTTGLFSFMDVHKDGVINSQDVVNGVASLDVKYYGGWNNSFMYKRWSLDITINIRVQKGISPLTQLYGRNPPGTVDSGFLSNQPAIVFDHWQHPGDQALLQRLSASPGINAYNAITEYTFSSAQVTDASFIRLKNASLSYRLPERLLIKWHLSDFRIYLQGQNLLTHTRYPFGDPETQNIYALPPLRTIACGIRLTF